MISVRWIVTIGVVALTTLIVLAAAAISEHNARQALTFEVESRLVLEARNLGLGSSAPLLGDFPELMLQPVVKNMQTRQPELAFIAVLDRHGVVQGHSDVRQLGSTPQLPAHLTEVPNAPPKGPGETLLGNSSVLVASAPVLSPDGQPIGRAVVGLRRAYLERMLADARRQQLAALAAFLLVGIAAAYALSWYLMRPIAPLRTAIESIGRGDLDTVVEIRDRTELGALAGTLNRMAGELKRAQLELVDRERLAHEMQLARRIQLSLLPSAPAQAGAFRIEGTQIPAAEVGGDYYQFFDLPGDRVGLAVADVSGKGLAGSLVTAMLHALLRASVARYDSPGALLTVLDREIGEILELGTFVTLFYGILEPESGKLTFASAGHLPILHFRAAGARVEWVRAPGPPLGAIRGTHVRHTYRDLAIELGGGDVLVQCTDGITEAVARNSGAEFGADRLGQVVSAAVSESAAVLGAITDAVARWHDGRPQDDDETLLAVSVSPGFVSGPAQSAADRDRSTALACLARAEAAGERLTLPASLAALPRVGEWFDRLAARAGLAGRAADIARLALHEACANVVEHAYAQDPARSLDLWWVPPDPAATRSAATETALFVLRDHGSPFRQVEHRQPSLEDPSVRRRGRGLGLEILHRAAERLIYCPETLEGNLLVMRFGSDPAVGREACA